MLELKILTFLSLFGMGMAWSQLVPYTAFEPRNTGQTAEIEPSEAPKIVSKEKMVRSISYCALTEDRTWTSKDGKTIQGQLIAFEDLVADAPRGVVPVFPALPQCLTVVREKKIRILINKTPVVMLLSLLGDADQKLIEMTRANNLRK